MARFVSLPHHIEAFQFLKNRTEVPKWFEKAVEIGKAHIVMNNLIESITVFGDSQSERAFVNDWVCLSDHGKIFVLDNKSFHKTFIRTDDV